MGSGHCVLTVIALSCSRYVDVVRREDNQLTERQGNIERRIKREFNAKPKKVRAYRDHRAAVTQFVVPMRCAFATGFTSSSQHVGDCISCATRAATDHVSLKSFGMRGYTVQGIQELLASELAATPEEIASWLYNVCSCSPAVVPCCIQ